MGSGLGIPTAAVVFIIAALAGVPFSTAISRSVVAGFVVWISVAIACRVLFTFLIRDWEQKTARQYQSLREAQVAKEAQE